MAAVRHIRLIVLGMEFRRSPPCSRLNEMQSDVWIVENFDQRRN